MPLWRSLSLQARQLLAASLGLIAFLGLTGYSLDQAFQQTAESAQRERLKSYALAYIGGIEITRSCAVSPPEAPPDPDFNRPGSGLYAAARGDCLAWETPSALGRNLPPSLDLSPMQERFDGPFVVEDEQRQSPMEVYRYAIGLQWEVGSGEDARDILLTFDVFQDSAAVGRQVQVFRRALWAYLGAAALLLLGVQVLVLRWSLLPVRRVARDLREVEQGRSELLEGNYPRELTPLTGSINALVESEREHLERYRNTLSDLAHSLKTPLAVMRSRLESGTSDELRDEVKVQVQRMSDIVSYQLSRAAATGHQLFAAPLDLGPKAEEIVLSLEKVYAGKGVLCEFDVAEGAQFHGEEGDLLELLGNLLENAFKWAQRRVLLTVRVQEEAGNRRPGLLISVEDDGPGIPAERVERLLQRGVRGDERVQGHGIGLSIVQDIVRAYRGELKVDASPDLGGSRFSVRFPPAL
ncbi:ATP-binding protein [Alkalisalibacterium limincola]|uniref:histidine kinase n=1 Tax=Alkalisalibacterium limincola TaxID=2699169 RepID=A0A5C8KJD8_9GAMM|nr:ATP-binding protein [Alkalisalibacterium limincola]TXK59827.1 GHKL domain-containing protein [Alkalisalibacterium limincola]